MSTMPSVARRAGADLPGHMELPYKDDLPVDNILQPVQQHLLTEILFPVLKTIHPSNDFCVAEDVGIYWKYDEKKPLKGCKAPDWFYVPGVPILLDGLMRRSYVMWKEEVPPLIVVELVSGDGSEEHDRTPERGKFWVYEKAIRARYYAIHEMESDRLEVFELNRSRYRKMKPNDHGRFPIAEIDVELGVWQGTHQDFTTHWLRFWDANGRLLPTAEEIADRERQRADQAQQRADQAQQRADQEQERAERLLEKLRRLGIDPNGV